MPSIMLKTVRSQEVNTQPPQLFLTRIRWLSKGVEEENDAVLGKDENQSAAEKNGVKKRKQGEKNEKPNGADGEEERGGENK